MPRIFSAIFFVKFLVITLFLILFTSFPLQTFAWSNGMSASVVVGQQNFNSGSSNQGGTVRANTLSYIGGVATDGTRLFVSDFGNNRVLIYNHIPTSNNASADIVIGQQNFNSGSSNQGGSVNANTLNGPTGLFYDTNSGKLFITDSLNNRVLIYNQIPTANNASADVVIGQPDFTHSSRNQGGTVNANTLSIPQGVYYDSASGKLYIADSSNNRVLVYNQLPTSGNASADFAIGQPNLVSNGATAAANALHFPVQVGIVNNRLFIADSSSARVVIYNQIPTNNNAFADVAVGQKDLSTLDTSKVDSSISSWTYGVASDGTKLFVLDAGNNRLLVYNSIPASSGALADTVLGQNNFSDKNRGTTATTLNDPEGELAFTNKQLIVGDSGNNRVLIFNDDSLPSPTPAPSTPTPTQENTSSPNPNQHENFEKTVNAGAGFVGDLTPITSAPSTSGGSAQAIIPNNTSVNALFVSVNPVITPTTPTTTAQTDNNTNIPLTQTVKATTPPTTLNQVSNIFSYSAVSAFNGYPIYKADKPYTVIVPYDPLKTANVPQKYLKLAYFDVNSNSWKILQNNTVVNPITHIVANTSTQFTNFTVVDSRSFGNTNSQNSNNSTNNSQEKISQPKPQNTIATPILTQTPKSAPKPQKKQCVINFFGVKLLCN